MKITMVGSGYVGLTTGTCFAELGNTVTCVDNDKAKIETLKSGKIPIFEPGLDELVKNNVEKKRLFFSTGLASAARESDVVFIAVGTPAKPDGDADLSFVENVAKEIAKTISKYTVIVEKSTVPVETGEKVARTIEKSGVKKELFDVVSNPEFLREGSAIEDFMKPDRIVVGTDSGKAKKIMKELYAPLNSEIVFTDVKSAEIIKHASNSFLATKISFINAVSRVCELSGADIEMVALGMGLDKRIGRQFLNAGLGYGGSCFPKDVSAFIKISQKKGYDFKVLKEVEKVNNLQLKHFVKKIEDALWNIKGKKIAVLGLSFKPNTDDLRMAPSIAIISALLRDGAKISVFDPVVKKSAGKIISKVEFSPDIYGCLKGADAMVVLTEWSDFKKIDFLKAKKIMAAPIVIDGRNVFDPVKMRKKGFSYFSVGR